MITKDLCFIFKHGRKSRLDLFHEIPSEFYYGYIELKKKKVKVSFVEDNEIDMSPPLSFLGKLINKFSIFFSNIPIGMLLPLTKKKNRILINKYRIVIATSNALGLALCLGKMLKLIKSDILFIVMGILVSKPSFWNKFLYKYILKNAQIISLSKEEQFFLNKKLGQKTYYLPFGVNSNFWKNYKSVNNQPQYILSIGNDSNRDWETLINSWDINFPLLKIITSHKIYSDKSNIEVINGDWRKQIISDVDIRKLYNNALFVVIPNKNTHQPAGQSSCLQAMSCSKLVLISNIDGIWDREKLIDNKNIIFVKPEDPKILNTKLKQIINNKKLIKYVGDNARKLVKEFFNTDIMAKKLYEIINQENDNKRTL